jgi:hypothetical protein
VPCAENTVRAVAIIAGFHGSPNDPRPLISSLRATGCDICLVGAGGVPAYTEEVQNWLRWVITRENWGFECPSFNCALQSIPWQQYDYVITLQEDFRLETGWDVACERVFGVRPTVGVIGCSAFPFYGPCGCRREEPAGWGYGKLAGEVSTGGYWMQFSSGVWRRVVMQQMVTSFGGLPNSESHVANERVVTLMLTSLGYEFAILPGYIRHLGGTHGGGAQLYKDIKEAYLWFRRGQFGMVAL